MHTRTGHRKNLWIPILTILIVYIGSVHLLAALLSGIPGLKEQEPGFLDFLIYTGSFLITIGYSVILQSGWIFHVPSFGPERWRPNARLIVGGMILILAGSIVLIPVLELLPSEYMDQIGTYIRGGFWPMATAVIAAPILEEFLFRGIIQKNLENRLGPAWGIIVSSLLFGGIHGIPQQVICASFFGIILGTIYHLTDSLTSVMAIHFLNNGFTALTYLFFGTSAPVEKEALESLGEGVGWRMAYALSVAILLIWGWYAARRIQRKRLRTSARNGAKIMPK